MAWRLRITPGPFDATAGTVRGLAADTDSKGTLRGPEEASINLFLALGDSWGNPVSRAPAGAVVRVVLQDNGAGGTELRYKMDVGGFARNEQAFL